MPEYRLYRLDHAGKIERAIDFDAESDDAALEVSRAMELGTNLELWQRERMVATISPGAN